MAKRHDTFHWNVLVSVQDAGRAGVLAENGVATVPASGQKRKWQMDFNRATARTKLRFCLIFRVHKKILIGS